MAKLISVSDDIYAALTSIKGEESYSKAIRALLAKRSNKADVMAYFGKGGVDPKMMKETKKLWSKWSEKYA